MSNKYGPQPTITGMLVDRTNPDPATINIIDICTSLWRQCRYSGHTDPRWTVGHHIIVCCEYYAANTRSLLVSAGLDPDDKGQAIRMLTHIALHDAPEYITGDITAPVLIELGIKQQYDAWQHLILEAIYERFELTMPNPAEAYVVRQVDEIVRKMELGYLFNSPHPAVLGSLMQISHDGEVNTNDSLHSYYTKHRVFGSIDPTEKSAEQFINGVWSCIQSYHTTLMAEKKGTLHGTEN